jgi:hypothetical protein
MASVMKGLQNMKLFPDYKVHLKNETILQDLRSLTPNTLVQVLCSTHIRCCSQCKEDCKCTSGRYPYTSCTCGSGRVSCGRCSHYYDT